jgi:hypothetical protein
VRQAVSLDHRSLARNRKLVNNILIAQGAGEAKFNRVISLRSQDLRSSAGQRQLSTIDKHPASRSHHEFSIDSFQHTGACWSYLRVS